MGRPSKGWRLRKRPGRPFSVRFTIGGVAAEPGLGTYDRGEAEKLAARVYADAVRGHRTSARRSPARGQALAEVAGKWLTSVAPALDPETRATYALYADTHWSKYWPTVESVSEATAAEYARSRLRKVSASTVRKELSALRGMIEWAHQQGLLPDAPRIPGIPKRAVGAVHKFGRRGSTELSPDEVSRILVRLPKTNQLGFPVQAYFTVLYETGLRPGTIEALSVPEHWRPKGATLTIPRELDKARDGRPVPLTLAAVAALTEAAPKSGIIFGSVDYRISLRVAALPVIGEERAKLITPYDLRRARLTHWAEDGGNLPGVMHLAGHKSLSTTAKYVRGSERAARDVLSKRRR